MVVGGRRAGVGRRHGKRMAAISPEEQADLQVTTCSFATDSQTCDVLFTKAVETWNYRNKCLGPGIQMCCARRGRGVPRLTARIEKPFG
jgi:hypothetical protein